MLCLVSLATAANDLCTWNNPIAHWELIADGTDCAKDYDFTSASEPDYTAAGADFVAASTEYLEVANASFFGSLGTNPFTICFNATMDLADEGYLVSNMNAGTNNDGIQIRKNAGGGETRYRLDEATGIEATSNVGTNYEWCFVRNATSTAIYQNAVWKVSAATSGSTTPNPDSINFTLCKRADTGAGYCDGRIKDLTVYDTALSGQNISDRYAKNFPELASVNSSTIDLLFSNRSGNFKTVFDEGENFNIFVNYTNTTAPITNSTGFCNITLIDGIDEVEGNQALRSICSTGCTIPSLEKTEVNFNSALNAVNDSIRFKTCHSQILSGDVSVTFQCGILTITEVISYLSIPKCDVGMAQISIENDVCVGSEKVNFTISSPVIYNKRKNISEIDFDREYSTHTVIAEYNASVEMWQSPHDHEYYEHGSKSISANCSSSNPQFNNSVTESITIVNIPPSIIFSGVRTLLGFTSSAAPMIIEYADGLWNWSVSVSDDDLTSFNVSWYNSSNGLIANYSNIVTDTVLLTISELFNDFTNPYSINISAIDSMGNTSYLSRSFNVTDTTNPYCDFETRVRASDDNQTFSVTCSDENFFSLNVTCPANNWSFSVEGLNVPVYFFNQTPILNVTDTCIFEYCDGHTAPLLLNDWAVDDKDDLEFFMDSKPVGKFWVERDGTEYNYDMKPGKISFGFVDNSKSIDNWYSIFYNASPNSYYFKSDKYKAWIVDANSRTAFDLNGLSEDVNVIERNNGLWEIRFFSKERSFSFESIVELNCVSGSFSVYEGYFDSLEVGACPDTVAGMLSLWLVVLIGLFLIVFGYVTRVAVFMFLGALIIMVSTWYLAGCASMVAFILALVSFIIMLWSVLFFNPFGRDQTGILQ